VDFESIANLDGQEFGFGAGQPYASIGLSLLAIVSADANLDSASRGVAVWSPTIYANQFQNSLSMKFSTPQQAVGFYYRDQRATSFKLQAFDVNYVLLEEGVFTPPSGFAGIIRPEADIFFVITMAPHNDYDDADQSRTFIDDLSFAAKQRRIPVSLVFLAWLWTILVGVILVTPIGPLCIVCGNPIGGFGTRVLGVLTVVLGVWGLIGQVRRST
jgi:hypothetical protein